MEFWLENFFWDMRFFVGKIFFRHGKKNLLDMGFWLDIGKKFWDMENCFGHEILVGNIVVILMID